MSADARDGSAARTPPAAGVPSARMRPAGVSDTRRDAMEALLDAAERLLVAEGHAAITTRRLAKEAGVNHGLVHYYFGSMEEVMVQVLERFTERLIARQRAMYGSDAPFLAKWRTAWGFQEDDLAGGYSKIWLELQALSWNRPELRARVQRVNGEWRRVLTETYEPVLRRYGIDDAFPTDAVVALVMTMAQGYALERLSGIEVGHEALLRWIEDWLAALERRGAAR